MKRKRSFRTVRTAQATRSERYPRKSVHAERHIARGIRAALRLELWRRQRARELVLAQLPQFALAGGEVEGVESR
jgi:hypothetical protein